MKKIILAVAVLCASLFAANAAAQNILPPDLVRYGLNYKATTTMAANTPDTIFAPGSNTKGAIVWNVYISGNGGGDSVFTVLAKTSAPSTYTDGDVIHVHASYSTSGNEINQPMTRPVFIPAGKGLYVINVNSVATINFRSVLYTLLQ
jgi:hypothetical protein